MTWKTAAAALALLLAGTPLVAADGSFGVSPPSLDIEDAQHGVSYRREVNIQNEFDSETNVTLKLSGEVGNWTELGKDSGFVMEPHSAVDMNVTVTIPEDAVNGTYQGKIHITADAKGEPNGSGASLRSSVAVLLNVSVGGDANVDLVWKGAQARDVEVGSPPRVTADVVNRGNVRTDASLQATVYPIPDGDAVADATGSQRLIPGEEATVPLGFDDSLPQGTYEARVTSTGPGTLDENVTFKVVPPGTLGKDGTLRYITHESWVDAGQPVKITAFFENTGTTSIAEAHFQGEVRRDDTLVGALESSGRVVAPNGTLNMTDFFTPEEGGTHTVTGHVTYDGFRTPDKTSILNVQGGASSWFGPYSVAGLLFLALLLGGAIYVYRRDDDEAES